MGWVKGLFQRVADLMSALTFHFAPRANYVPKPPHPLNTPGSFYVEDGCCLACGVWEDVAPDLLAWAPDDEPQCYVARQPETDAEFERMKEAMEVGEVDCIRVRNCRPDWAAKLRDAGMGAQIDEG